MATEFDTSESNIYPIGDNVVTAEIVRTETTGMKTIEEYEVEIAAKSDIIRAQLDKFQENIGRIGKVIGKDSTVVYDTLVSQFNDVVQIYSSTTRRNPEILQGYVNKLNKILNVLAGVMQAIDRLDTMHDEDEITVKDEVDQIMEDANEAVNNLVTGAEEALEPYIGESAWLHYLIWGGGAFLVCKLLKLPTYLCIAGAITALILADKPES